jgi:acetyl esterase/lipase
VTLPDYRLAPENPFPAALYDAAAVYGCLIRSDAPVFVAGDSAGGGLAAALVVLCSQDHARGPDGIILLSPWLDLALTSETYISRAETDRFFPLASAEDAAGAYLQGHSADDPLVSPIRADLSGFPPTLLMAGTDETLLGDALRFSTQLATAGRDVTLWVAEGMQHAWPAISADLPETAQAVRAIGAFVERIAAARASPGR